MSPFGGAAKAPSGPANPFGSSSSPRPFIEPSGMSPDMQQYPMSTEPWWKQITITQVVRALILNYYHTRSSHTHPESSGAAEFYRELEKFGSVVFWPLSQ